MNQTRMETFTIAHRSELWATDCAQCGTVFAIPATMVERRLADGRWFYCPNGHAMSWAETEVDRQRAEADAAEARVCHLEDQLTASLFEAEAARQRLMVDRHRFSNGVCPCCNRSFTALARHMSTQHPDYDPADLRPVARFTCSCGREFASMRGLRVHQGMVRKPGWITAEPPWRRHLTVIGDD